METSNNSNNHNPGQCQTAWNTSSSRTNGLMSVWYYWYSQSRSGGEGWWCRADISQQEVVCHLPSAETWTETDRWTGSVLITGFHTTENIVIINSVYRTWQLLLDCNHSADIIWLSSVLNISNGNKDNAELQVSFLNVSWRWLDRDPFSPPPSSSEMLLFSEVLYTLYRMRWG